MLDYLPPVPPASEEAAIDRTVVDQQAVSAISARPELETHYMAVAVPESISSPAFKEPTVSSSPAIASPASSMPARGVDRPSIPEIPSASSIPTEGVDSASTAGRTPAIAPPAMPTASTRSLTSLERLPAVQPEDLDASPSFAPVVSPVVPQPAVPSRFDRLMARMATAPAEGMVGPERPLPQLDRGLQSLDVLESPGAIASLNQARNVTAPERLQGDWLPASSPPESDDPMTRLVAVAELVSSPVEDLQRSGLQTAARRIGSLDERVAALEAQQFSSTAVLRGQVIMSLAAAGGGNPPGRGAGGPVFISQTQLQILSSFTGRDLFRLGLATGNFGEQGFANPNSLNTNMALLSYQTDLRNQIQLNTLEYRLAALDDRVVFVIQPIGFSLNSVLSSNSPYADAGGGSVSRFAALNPVLRIGSLTTGVGLDWLVFDTLRLQLAYGTRDGGNTGQGLFGADQSALGVQFLYKPAENLVAGLSYVNSYASNGQLATFTGSYNADVSGGFNQPATINAVGLSFQWQPLDNITIGGWGGAMVTKSFLSDAIALSTTYLFSLGLADPFGRRGDLVGVLVGQPPKLNIGLVERSDQGTSMHIEAFYRIQLTDHITLSPGFFYVTNPGHIPRNQDIYAATVRLTLSF